MEGCAVHGGMWHSPRLGRMCTNHLLVVALRPTSLGTFQMLPAQVVVWGVLEG